MKSEIDLIGKNLKYPQDCNRRQDSPMVTTVDARAHRNKAAHEWQLDEALKRTRNMTMISVLYSDSDRPSDQEKGGQPVEENRAQAEKPKVDARKRGRPRKPTNPKAGHRTSDESLKNGKPRSRTRGVGNHMKKKPPLSKANISTSEDESDDRSQGASSDSDSDRPPTRVSPGVAAMNDKRRSRLSGSSSEDESPPKGKSSNNNNNNNNVSEDDSSRWRRMTNIKRSKLGDSPKKQEKKSPAKAKPRRSTSRVNNGSDSDSESEIVRNRIQVAR